MGVVEVMLLSHIAEMKIHSRSTGRVNTDTRQPPQRRKKGGGGTFGEMEIVAVISHGASFTAKQRYCDLSDAFEIFVCEQCHMLVDDVCVDINFSWCRRCASERTTFRVKVPFTFHVLVHNLYALGIAVFIKVQKITK